jgi:pimeloyl-ACP methyl ester carboxylesterase
MVLRLCPWVAKLRNLIVNADICKKLIKINMNIILLHGAIGTKDQMKPMDHAFKDSHRVFSYDFPGHGEHPEFEQDFSIEVFENWILNEIKNIEGDIAILGYSLGGYVALRLALILPDKIKAVMTYGTIFDWHPEQSEKQIKMINPLKIEEKVPVFADQLRQSHGDKWKNVLNKTHGLLKQLGNKPLLNAENLMSIQAKCLISVGDRDALVSIEESDQTRKMIPNAALAVYPSSAHPFEKAPHDKIKRDFLELLIT